MVKNSLSFNTLIFNDLAFCSFDPALSPTITKSVFLLTDERIFAPLVFAKYFASSLDKEFNVPVKTIFLSKKKLFLKFCY